MDGPYSLPFVKHFTGKCDAFYQKLLDKKYSIWLFHWPYCLGSNLSLLWLVRVSGLHTLCLCGKKAILHSAWVMQCLMVEFQPRADWPTCLSAVIWKARTLALNFILAMVDNIMEEGHQMKLIYNPLCASKGIGVWVSGLVWVPFALFPS